MNEMHQLVKAFPQQLTESLTIADQTILPELPMNSEITSVLVIGMGGSAFASEIVKNACLQYLKYPIEICRSYHIPGYVSENTFVLICSYSGTTEETLAAAEEVFQRKSPGVIISTGGKLAPLAKEYPLELITLPAGFPPRSAFGFSLIQQLNVLEHYGFLENYSLIKKVPLLIEQLRSFDKHTLSQEIAGKLKHSIFPIYCPDVLESVAIRMRQQIQENSKHLCWHHVVPEMNHNELVGWDNPNFNQYPPYTIFIRSRYEHERVSQRFAIMEEVLSKKTEIITLQVPSESKFIEIMLLIHWIDWISLYLAEANQIDPVPVNIIDYFKSRLEKSMT